MEFKGTKGKWETERHQHELCGDYLIVNENDYQLAIVDNEYIQDYEETKANALLISKAPEMLDMLNKARLELSRIKSSMMAHPDCTIGSEFDDYTSTAQECENEIELLIREATEL